MHYNILYIWMYILTLHNQKVMETPIPSKLIINNKYWFELHIMLLRIITYWHHFIYKKIENLNLKSYPNCMCHMPQPNLTQNTTDTFSTTLLWALSSKSAFPVMRNMANTIRDFRQRVVWEDCILESIVRKTTFTFNWIFSQRSSWFVNRIRLEGHRAYLLSWNMRSKTRIVVHANSMFRNCIGRVEMGQEIIQARPFEL